jgi:hypothetical protein
MDLDRPSNGGHVSRDHPLRETGSREIGSPVDKRSGLSIEEIPGWIWVVRWTEATCRKSSHFGKSGIAESGFLLTRVRDFSMVKTLG